MKAIFDIFRGQMTVSDTSILNGLTYWTESSNTLGTNYQSIFTPLDTAYSNVSAVITPKGAGSFSLAKSDGTNSNGNPRGMFAIDLSLQRSTATQVASGVGSFNSGGYGTASGDYAINLGSQSIVSANYAINFGSVSTVSGLFAFNSARNGTVSGNSAINLGDNGIVYGISGFNTGVLGQVTADYAINLGYHGQARTPHSINLGKDSAANGYAEIVSSSGNFLSSGIPVRRQFILKAQTSDATPKVLTADEGLATTVNQLTLVNWISTTFTALVSATTLDGSIVAGWVIKGVVSNPTVDVTTLHSSPIETLYNPNNWIIVTSVVGDEIVFTFTGQAAADIKVAASIEAISIS